MKIYHSYLKLVTTITILFALHAHKVKSGTVPSLIFCFFCEKDVFRTQNRFQINENRTLHFMVEIDFLKN